MMEEEKNAPLGKKEHGLGDEDRIHVCKESSSGGMPSCFLDWQEKRKKGNVKVNKFDESISSTPDFHLKEVM